MTHTLSKASLRTRFAAALVTGLAMVALGGSGTAGAAPPELGPVRAAPEPDPEEPAQGAGADVDPVSSGDEDFELGATAGEAGGEVEGPTERSVEIVALQIRGRKQVTARQISEALEAEGLVEGSQVFWPEDPRIDRALQRLRSTGYFDQVAIRLVPVADRADQASLIIEVHEKGSLQIRDIHGQSSVLTPFAGGFDMVERNLAGRSVHLGAAFVVGVRPVGLDTNPGPGEVGDDPRRQQAYKLFTELPAIAGSSMGVAASAYAISANEPYRVSGAGWDPSPSHFDTIPYQRYGGVIGVTVPFRADLSLGIDFRVEAINAELPDFGAELGPERVFADGTTLPVDLHLEDGLHVLSTAEFSFSWDQRSRAAILGKGGHIRIDVELSSPAIGSRYEYLRVLIGGGYSFRLPWGHWLTPSVWGGQIAGDAPRFVAILPGDMADWTPGRTMGLQYSTRYPIDVFNTGVDELDLGLLGGRVDLEYGVPLFRFPQTSFLYGGYLYVSAGVFTLMGDEADRARRVDAGLPRAPVGLNGDFGIKLDTSIGTFDISVGSILERAPL